MVVCRPSITASRWATRRGTWGGDPVGICPSSPSGARIGVRFRGLDRGRFSRSGEGLLPFLSVRGEVTDRPDRRTSGDECRISNISMGVEETVVEVVDVEGLTVMMFGVKGTVVSRCSGMLSARLRRTGRGSAIPFPADSP
jgi:hypothetical protein